MNHSGGMNRNNLVPVKSLTDWVQIDQGHFGSVHKAKHKDYKVDVAVKKLKGNVESQGLEELIAEAEKMASASASPYVIRLYGILEDNPQSPPGIVMEYMRYGSLFSLMETVNPIPWALKFRIIYQVALGMNWLHNLPVPILHLDLKTKNVLLTEELHIKISDFGLSKYTRGSSTYINEECGEGVGGTLQYMPPEAFQEGYQPGPPTDVYSFAILSAVVFKGEDPYPVDESFLIRRHVTAGQRPCLKELEKMTTVKYLHEATEFTKRCWDNDKLKRPPFSECCAKWEVFSSAFNMCETRDAVREVQERVESCMSSGKTTNVPYTGDTWSVNTKDMSEMVYRLSTMNFIERPQVLLGSVPVRYSTNGQSQHGKVYPEALQQGHLQGAVGPNYRPQTAYYPGAAMNSPNVPGQHSGVHQKPTTGMGSNYRPLPPGYHVQGAAMNSPNVPGQHSGVHQKPTTGMGSNYRPLPPGYHVQGPFPGWPLHFPGYPYAPANFPQVFPTNPSAINISNSNNFQIGDNTVMNVTDHVHPGSYRNMSTIRNCNPTPMSPQQKPTTQGYYYTPARATSSGQPYKQQTVVKSEQQSHNHPIHAETEDHSSNASNTQISQGSGSTTENPTTKDPGQ